jgi:hypothetical protein
LIAEACVTASLAETYSWKMPEDVAMPVGPTVIHRLPNVYLAASEQYSGQTRVLHTPDSHMNHSRLCQPPKIETALQRSTRMVNCKLVALNHDTRESLPPGTPQSYDSKLIAIRDSAASMIGCAGGPSIAALRHMVEPISPCLPDQRTNNWDEQ